MSALPLSAAREVFRGDAKDGGYGVSSIVLRDPDGKVQAILAHRPLDTFNANHYLITDAGPKLLNLPLKSSAWLSDPYPTDWQSVQDGES